MYIPKSSCRFVFPSGAVRGLYSQHRSWTFSSLHTPLCLGHSHAIDFAHHERQGESPVHVGTRINTEWITVRFRGRQEGVRL